MTQPWRRLCCLQFCVFLNYPELLNRKPSGLALRFHYRFSGWGVCWGFRVSVFRWFGVAGVGPVWGFGTLGLEFMVSVSLPKQVIVIIVIIRQALFVINVIDQSCTFKLHLSLSSYFLELA